VVLENEPNLTQKNFTDFCCEPKTRKQDITMHSIWARRLRMQHSRHSKLWNLHQFSL